MAYGLNFSKKNDIMNQKVGEKMEKNYNSNLQFNTPENLIANKNVAFGGSFNPPTIAHLELIKKILTFNPSKIILIPNGDDYIFDNIDKGLAKFKDRVKMCELLFSDISFKNYEISEIENSHHFLGTFSSLRDLNHPTFIIGDDCLLSFKRWKNYETLLKENNFIVFTRSLSKCELEKYILNDVLFKNYTQHFAFIEVNFKEISSTNYRISHNNLLIPYEIDKYIKENNLYEVTKNV